MSLRDEHLDDATILSRGEFRLDRRRAMEKLARFQLEHPHRYVLELVATAVRAGATGIRIRNDADDFEIEWDGEHPTSEELEALFDHIFTRSMEGRARMLQHLAQGIHGALGLDPKWVHLERPGARLDLSDPTNVTFDEAPRRQGVLVHVRERFGLDVLRELVRPFDVAYEEKILRADAAWCPLPVEVNGRPLRRPLTGPPPNYPSIEGLWLADAGDVAVVRDGIRVESLHVDLGPIALAGHIRADGVRLNASRSKAVRDEHWRKVEGSLYEAAGELLVEKLHAEVASFTVGILRQAALRLLRVRRGHHGPLRKEEVLEDGAGRLWSFADIFRAELIRRYDTVGIAAPELPEPQFHSDSPVLQLIDELGLKTKDSQSFLEDLAQGRRRRQQLRSRALPLSHGRALHERRFEGEGIRGTVAFDALFDEKRGARLELRVEGLPVEVVTIPVPGPISVRVESERLRADPRFRRVVSDGARKEVVARCIEEARALLAEVAEKHPRRALVKGALLEQVASSEELSDTVERVPLFDTLDEGLVSLETIRSWSSKDGGLRWARSVLVVPFGAPRVLHPQPAQLKALRARFKKLEDVTTSLEDELVRRRRFLAPPMPPKITGYVVARAYVETDEFHGEIGLGVEGGESRTVVVVLHHGIDLGQLKVPTGLPATLAVLELPGAEGDARMEGLKDPQAWVCRLSKELLDPLRSLVLANVHSPDREAPLQAWLEGALRGWRPLPNELETLAFAQHADGSPFALIDLPELPKGPVECLPEAPPSCPPDLQHVLVLDASRRRVVQSVTKRALRDVSQRFQLRREAHDRFMKRASTSTIPIGDVVAIQPLGDEDLRVTVALSVDPEREPSLRVRVLHQDRLLCTEIQPFPVPADAVVMGPRIVPDPLFSSMADQHEILGATLKQAETALGAWLGFAALPANARRALLLYLLRIRSEPTVRQAEVLAKLRSIPLLPRMDGYLARLDDIETEAALVPQRLAGSEVPDDRTWLIGSRVVRQLLEAAGVEIIEGRLLLEAYEQGEQRRERLEVETLAPKGLYGTFWRADAGHWLGLLDAGGGRIDWLLQQRCVSSEKLPFPVHVRVDDARLRAHPDFSGLVGSAELESARARARALADEFMVRVMRRLAGEEAEGLYVMDAGSQLPAVLAWAAQADPEVVPETAFLPTSTGESIGVAELRDQAARGCIRVAHAGTRGRPAEPDRPVITLHADSWCNLQPFGRVEDYGDELAREVAARGRMEAEPQRVLPRADPTVVLTMELSGDREGFLQVHDSGKTYLHLHVGWRQLTRIAHRGPVPLSGHVSDPAIEADDTWSGPEDGAALQALRQFLVEKSEEALEQLLDAGPPYPTRLWLGILRRTFRHRRDVPSPRGKPRHGDWKNRLAGVPLFPTGGGETLSAWEVVQLRQKPRWVSPELAAPSLDRPFLVLERSLHSMAIEFFGGTFDREAALEAQRVHSRRSREAQPFALTGRYYAEAQLKGKGWKALLAIDAGLGPGRLSYRCKGVPLCTEASPFPGLAGVVDVDEAKPDFTGPKPLAARDAALLKSYVELVERAAPKLRDACLGRQRLAGVLQRAPSAIRAAWARIPLFETVDGWTTAAALEASIQQHGVVLYGSEIRSSGPLMVLHEPANERLIDAFGLKDKTERLGAWEAAQEAAEIRDELRKLDARQARSHNRLLRALKKSLGDLLEGLASAAWAKEQAHPELLPHALREAAEASPDGAPMIMAVWYLADAALRERGTPWAAQELAIRVGERFAGVTSQTP